MNTSLTVIVLSVAVSMHNVISRIRNIEIGSLYLQHEHVALQTDHEVHYHQHCLEEDVSGVDNNTADTSLFTSCRLAFFVTTWSFCLAIFHEMLGAIATSIIFSYVKQYV